MANKPEHSLDSMSDRQIILEAVQKMPEKASMTEILDELNLLESVKAGLAETEHGAITPHEEVPKLIRSWITKSSGRTAA